MRYSVVVIGAGFAGIGTAIQLQNKGIDDFVILERATRAGGTWRDNTYPGAACDIPSRLYSYGFAPNSEWSRTFSGSGEILAYIESLTAEHGLLPHIRFGHEVTRLHYDESSGDWTIDVAGRSPIIAGSVVLASGPLANPSTPAIPGAETFAGHTVHSARWDHDYDFAGKRVAVIGTGASAVQVVPEIVSKAKSVKVFQRTPGWVLPRRNGHVSGRTKQWYRRWPQLQKLSRSGWFWGHESVAVGVVWNTPLTRIVETVSKLNLRLQVKDPWLRRQLTPDFAAGCKRLLMTSDFYPALQQDNCKLVTWPIARIAPQGIRTVEGIEHQFDCIVYATGFDVARAKAPLPITGRGGRELDEDWSRGSYAYRSVAVHGYPNLFITFGPNSGPGHNSALVYMEAQINYITNAITEHLRHGWTSLEVRADAQASYNESIQRRLARTTWNSGCHSWYLTEDGFNATMFPGFATQFIRQLKSVDYRDYVIRRRDPAAGADTPMVREDVEAVT